MQDAVKKLLESNLAKVIPWVLGVTFIAGGIYGASTYQTKEDAQKEKDAAATVFVKKEVQIEKDKRDDDRWEEVGRRLGAIEKNQNDLILLMRKR